MERTGRPYSHRHHDTPPTALLDLLTLVTRPSGTLSERDLVGHVTAHTVSEDLRTEFTGGSVSLSDCRDESRRDRTPPGR